jgi:hypothetical protein
MRLCAKSSRRYTQRPRVTRSDVFRNARHVVLQTLRSRACRVGFVGLSCLYADCFCAPPSDSRLFPLLDCWPSQVLNSSSRLKRTFSASVMTYDGVESMNLAYWSSCAFTDSSTRAWIVTAFGCLGGALMIAMLLSHSSSLVLSYVLSYKLLVALPCAAKTRSAICRRKRRE